MWGLCFVFFFLWSVVVDHVSVRGEEKEKKNMKKKGEGL